MKNFTDKLIAAHAYTGENSSIVSIVNELSITEESLVEYVIQKMDKLISKENVGEDEIIRMDFEKKIKLLAIVYNSSNDVLLYPKTMRDEYIKRWSEELGIQEIVMRKCLILGADKIENIVSDFS